MAERVETRDNVFNYMLLAGKSRGMENKQSQKMKDQELSFEEKYKSFSSKESGKKGEGPKENKKKTNEHDNFQEMSNSDIEGIRMPKKNKMAARSASSYEDDEVIFQKHVKNTYLGSVHDSETGSMMPVMLQTEIDGSKSKITGMKVSHGTHMGGSDGMVQEMPGTRLINKKSVSGRKKKRLVEKHDSDLEIIESISSGEPDSAVLQDSQQPVRVEWPELEIDTNVNSSEDDLDVDINNNDKEEQYKERPLKAHSMKAQGLSGQSHKIFIQRKQKRNWNQ